MVFGAQINDVRKEVQVQKAVLSQELTSFRLETQEGLNTLRAQLSEIISYINRGRDDKREKRSSRGPKPKDRSRPSGGVSILFVPSSLKSFPILIEGVMTKGRREVVEVQSLKTEADLVEVEVVEAEVNHRRREEVVRTEE
ncbi:protein GRIP [Dorcoceras hygrometricum]|uniref:Protein GRIP n=1 Tax=Dorcoceras hygrometricum TaxID=472368 RepID=A0A2Z7CGQ3_9LAMI|nr:protein GRIP [Dorcoceras hygrometricum]